MSSVLQIVFFLVTFIFTVGYGADPAIEEEELRARAYLQYLNEKTSERENKLVVVNWEHATNITKNNLMIKLMITEAALRETKEDWEETKQFNWRTYRDPNIKRQFKRYLQLDEEALPDDKYKRLMKLTNDLTETYSTTKVCLNSTFNCKTVDELSALMLASGNADDLANGWIAWHKAIGTPHMRRVFQDYVKYMNEAANLNGEKDAGGMWLSVYEAEDIKDQIKNIWEQIRPLYVQLHAYVRARLRVRFGTVVSEKSPISVNLLGNLWGQNWKAVHNSSEPYPIHKPTSVTDEMKAQNFTPLKIMQTAENFYTSLGLLPVPETFWNDSIFEKPKDVKMGCHPSAWDFFNGRDFRIKMCAKVDEETLIIAHHEMGHIQYYMQYKDLPNIYRSGANDAFHEAVGDAVTLSANTAKYLHAIGLRDTDKYDEKELINRLYYSAVTRLVALPFSYTVDCWRWNVFSGNIKPEEYNCRWWHLRNEIQGVQPPNDRYESDFDPVSKYHIVASAPQIKYFISYVLQFQFHKALCDKVVGQSETPLHECSIYGSKEAGKVFGEMMQMGASRPWQDALEVISGQRHMDATGIIEYFEPLMKWLVEENKKYKAFIGWEQPTHVCKSEARP